MQSLKIKVNSEAESKEVQTLLFELGYSDRKNWTKRNPEHNSIQAWQDGEFTFSLNHNDAPVWFKETTITELRDMVSPVQEYLNTETYEYKLANTKPDGEWVEIPEGATSAAIYDFGGIEFYKDGVGEFFNNMEMQWESYSGSIEGKLIWLRPTQPEALPFIDDNPQSLNEQYAEIEQVRQQSIEATLAERGSRYGDFKSVAGTTRALMRVLSNGDTVGELSAAQHEALHMICSKMARIVNGDPDYKDNWHDIGGYAKLIENNI